MIPLDKGPSFSSYVARVLDIIDESGLEYAINPMGTVIEGDYDEVMALVRKCFKALEEDSERISITMKIDYRKGHRGRLKSKIEKVESVIGRSIKKS
jgi:uncharacterized protein (TIGR00106 family)